MKRFRRMYGFLIALILLCVMNGTVYAQNVPDLSQKGYIVIGMELNDQPVSGGTITLYQVGKAIQEDGNYSFMLTDDFTEWGKALTDIQSASLAKELAEYVTEHHTEGWEKEIDDEGNVYFGELEAGLYLIVQYQPCGGCEKADPFLVSVPVEENGIWEYGVDASPKVELEKDTDIPIHSDTIQTDRKLPQTGQLNWPVPVLLIAGMGIFACGWWMRFGKKESE